MLVAAVRAFVGSAAFVFPGRGPGWRGGAACAFWGSVFWGCLPEGLAGTPAGRCGVAAVPGARPAGQQEPCWLIPDSWWVQTA